MKLKEKSAKIVTEIFTKIAHKAAGQVSIGCTYQPIEPASLKKMR